MFQNNSGRYSFSSLPVALCAAILVAGLTFTPETAHAETDYWDWDEWMSNFQYVLEGESMGWWSPRYLVDYGLIAGGIGAFTVGERQGPTQWARIGPRYDPDDPTDIFESDQLNRTYREHGPGETYSDRRMMVTMGAVGAGIVGLESHNWRRGDGSGQQLHDAAIGYAETTAVTAGLTSWTKSLFGRLRPDFRDRALRYHCDLEPERYEEHCDGYEDRPLADEPHRKMRRLRDGRKSFMSGHASHSFNTFTYTSLLIGGHWVWAEDTTRQRRVLGIAAQTAMMGFAGFITASRVHDGRHHPTDVLAGSLLGLGVANASYWRRFDTDGNLRRGPDRSTGPQISGFGSGPGLSLSMSF